MRNLRPTVNLHATSASFDGYTFMSLLQDLRFAVRLLIKDRWLRRSR